LKKQIIMYLIFILTTIYFTGCGGGSSESIVPSSVTQNISDQVSYIPEEPLESGKGVFTVTLRVPSVLASSEITDSVVPCYSETLRVTITGEYITVPLVETASVSGGSDCTVTVINVPTGSNIASIELLDDSSNIVAQRKYGFFMYAGGTVTAGPLSLGVGIDGSGYVIPAVISIPVGTTLYFENQDYADDRTISLESGSIVVGPILHVEAGSGSDGYDKFHALSYTFNTVGEYVYDNGGGGDGTSAYKVVVYKAPEMVLLAGGTYQMGHVGPVANPPYSPELPQHEVTLNSFYMGKFEVTNAEYVEFLNEEGNQIEGVYGVTPVTWIDMSGSDWLGIEGSFPNFTVKSGYANRPVVFVSWYGAVAYCNWLSEKHGLVKCYGDHSADGLSRWGTNGANYQPENNGYRLATEAEWEYGCRGGTTTDFNWGGNYTGENMSPGPIDSYCWYCYNSSNNHHDVTTLLPNSWDLYHMHGNVWEWCSDWYDGTYYQYCDDYSIVNNPLGLETGSTRVLRGGGWDFYAFVCRSSDRSNGYPGVRSSVIGFRLVRSN